MCIISSIIRNEILGEPTTTCKSIDIVMNQDDAVNFPTEFLNLTLKIGLLFSNLQNISPP